MLGFLKSVQKRMRAINEVESIEPNVLEDFGLNRAQFRRLALTPDSVMRRMGAMAERHGVSARALDSNSRDRAAFAGRCVNCSKTQECGTFLADRNAGIEEATFCPNQQDFKWFARAVKRVR
uniref:DUF6455 family protein n=1 Tax=Pararhizobium sp. IMCC3301 TaxID=3067904 RepID=UPI002740BB5B|nr:DUF6455 family protein [Pararhizobium sp. IMCC3301]